MTLGKKDVRGIKQGHEGAPDLDPDLDLCESSSSQMLAWTGNSLGSRLSISSCPQSVYDRDLLPDGTVQVLLEEKCSPAEVFRSLPSSVWRRFVGRHFFRFLLVRMLEFAPGVQKAVIVSVLEMPFEQPDFECVGLSGQPLCYL